MQATLSTSDHCRKMILFLSCRLNLVALARTPHLTPREVIRDFIELLDIVYQNPSVSISTLLDSEDFSFAKPGLQEQEVAPLYAEFKI